MFQSWKLKFLPADNKQNQATFIKKFFFSQTVRLDILLKLSPNEGDNLNEIPSLMFYKKKKKKIVW